MDRMVLRDDQWERIAPLLPGKEGDPGRSEPAFSGGGSVDCAGWSAVARPSQAFRELELSLSAVPPLGQG